MSESGARDGGDTDVDGGRANARDASVTDGTGMGPGDGSVGNPRESCAHDLAGQFELVEIPLEVNAQQDQSVPVVVAPAQDGGLWVAWTDSPWSEGRLFAHIRYVSSSLEIDGPALDLPGSVVLGMHAHADGTLAVAHGRRTGPEHPDPEWRGAPGGVAPNTLFLSKFDRASAEVFQVRLRGGEGYENDPESTWLLSDGTGAAVSVAFDGTNYGLLYVIGRHFEDGGVHQADEYVAVTAGGVIVESQRSTWINSHSFWPSAVAAGGSVYTLTTADPFPVRGLRFGVMASEGGGSFATVWPPADVFDQVPANGAVARAGALFEVGGRLSTLVRTWVDRDSPSSRSPTRAAYLSMTPEGSLHSAVYFDPRTATAENDLVVSGARFGNEVLALIGLGGNASVFGFSPITAQVLSPDGTAVTEPVELNARISWSSDPITMRDGSAVWPAVKENVSTTLQLARIRCQE